MSRDDRISKLFRDNQHKLEEHPSPAVWERIESRLDKHRGRSEGRIQQLYRYAAVAAVLVLVLTMVGLFQLGDRQQERAMAQEQMPPVESLEELQSSEPIAQAEPHANTAEESAPSKMPSSSKEQPTSAPTAASAPAAEQSKEASEEVPEKLEKIELESPQPALRNRANEELSLDQVRVNNRRYAKPPIAAGNSSNVERKAAAEMPADIEPVAEDEVAVVERIEVKPSAQMASPNRPSSKRRQLMLREKAVNSYSNYSDAVALSMHRKLRKLDWLLGTWKGSEGLEGDSYEEWSLENENLLRGRGYHVIGGDKIFSEHIRIVYMPKLRRVYYVMYAEYGGEELAFPLIRATGNQVVFEQLDMPAEQPTRVTLERTKDGFRTIIENTNGELKANQQSYLQNRNHLSRYKAKRYMKRYEQ